MIYTYTPAPISCYIENIISDFQDGKIISQNDIHIGYLYEKTCSIQDIIHRIEKLICDIQDV